MVRHIPSEEGPKLLYSLKDLLRIRRELDRQLTALEEPLHPTGAGPSSNPVHTTTVTGKDGTGDGTRCKGPP